MAGVDENTAQEPESLPSTSRRVPTDNGQTANPTTMSARSRSDQQENAPAPPKHASIPPNPTSRLSPASAQASSRPKAGGGSPAGQGDLSYFETTALEPTLNPDDTISEDQVREHLKDMESSFLPSLSPIPTGSASAGATADDSFVFDSPAKRSAQPSRSSARPESSQSRPQLRYDSSYKSRPEYTNEFEFNPESEDDLTRASNTTSSLERFDSSPAAAAAARNISRSTSKQNTPKVPQQENDRNGQDDSLVFSTDGPTGLALRNKRPKYVRSGRFSSQRSSTSSFVTNPESQEDSDATVGTVGLGLDYALHSGGAVPNTGMSRSPSNLLRTISMGSMTSGLGTDEFGDNTRQLEPLAEVDTPTRGRESNYKMVTPKAKDSISTAPTDTVIAQHVKNVHVPDSVAKEFKFQNGLQTPRLSGSTATAINSSKATGKGTGKTWTLKEQSSTIERLSKENFDLKLKVMFLSKRLDTLSEEGLKEMISENVELRTNLAITTRDNKILRKRVKELEKKEKEDEERPSTARSGASSTDQTAKMYNEEAQEREEELMFLRERVETYATEIERLRSETQDRESEKKKLSDIVKTLGERSGSDAFGRQEEADVWKDLLEQETARREQSDEDNRKLRDEVFRLKKEMSGAGSGMLHHTTNIYNITKKPRDRGASPGRPMSSVSGDADGSHANFSAASTLVDELRRESEQLRHENAELRQRLYQEIEDLKMAQRRGGPAPSTIDSLLERSASRAGALERPSSRNSVRTRQLTAEDEAEREEMENKMAELRDKVSEVKLQNQDLQRELESCMADFELAINQKREADEALMSMQEELDNATNDLIALQSERDEALREHGEMEANFEDLRSEAQAEIDALEAEVQRLQADLSDRSENFESLQKEMRQMSEALLGLEDEQEHKLQHIQQLEEEQANQTHRIQHLEQEQESSNKELEELEQKLLESNEKNQRLSVQQESSQGEISFLREEQEADKIRIGDLEAALSNLERSLEDEKERVKELDNRMQEERAQWEDVTTKKDADVQQIFANLQRENASAKDEVKRLRKSLSSREVEATEWKERLLELENNLREALGDLNGTRSSLLKSIARMQRELENTVRELDTSKAALVEKDRIIKQRDSLLESHALETRKITELLEKERVAHRNTKSQFESFQKTHQHLTRTASTQDVRISELEATRGQDRRKLAVLEQTAREQLLERNELLLLLWHKLSTLCGREWANNNTLVDRQVVPTLEVIASRLPGFTKNLLSAVKTIEGMFAALQTKIKSVEKDLYREYQALENNLDVRIKKLDRLETMVRNSVATGSLGSHEASSRMLRLEEAYRQLKVENATLRTANDVRARAAHQIPGAGSEASAGSPSASRGTGDRPSKSRASSAVRAPSASGIPVSSSRAGLGLMDASNSDGSASNNDNRWLLRLRDMEYKLKMEREGRNQDRQAARQRLGGLETENRDLREKVRRANQDTE
ncbi:micro-tubular organizer mto1 c-term mto2-binding region domain-containing protein [Trichoderma breve]|uniref:Micro-tubular organizer mto1 c-term mto2-binding region domain-containing protein n=1 Tax=Trichoderma breve TaxID=2034170 RepID=A0A9W9BGB6_9HYPO|nr:micro-tubular organizer mto1 c-term mto2-binding region domain-containing protein [Trichoderma breve]KAJ4861794.1 micro-tubular organizer mto1 c-term mto2-binding region domain-containing protein [Trichoderma breve]